MAEKLLSVGEFTGMLFKKYCGAIHSKTSLIGCLTDQRIVFDVRLGNARATILSGILEILRSPDQLRQLLAAAQSLCRPSFPLLN